MNDKLILFFSAIAGLGLGTFFFGGLWFTVKKGMESTHPALWFMGSLLLRTSLTLLGFYFVANGELSRLLVCFAGFILVRTVITRKTKSPTGMNHEN